jgi:hypothetical protein
MWVSNAFKVPESQIKQTNKQSKESWEIPKHIFMQTQKQHNNPANNGETPLNNAAN